MSKQRAPINTVVQSFIILCSMFLWLEIKKNIKALIQSIFIIQCSRFLYVVTDKKKSLFMWLQIKKKKNPTHFTPHIKCVVCTSMNFNSNGKKFKITHYGIKSTIWMISSNYFGVLCLSLKTRHHCIVLTFWIIVCLFFFHKDIKWLQKLGNVSELSMLSKTNHRQF